MPIIQKRIINPKKNKDNMTYWVTVDRKIAKQLNLEHGDKFEWIIVNPEPGLKTLQLKQKKELEYAEETPIEPTVPNAT